MMQAIAAKCSFLNFSPLCERGFQCPAPVAGEAKQSAEGMLQHAMASCCLPQSQGNGQTANGSKVPLLEDTLAIKFTY